MSGQSRLGKFEITPYPEGISSHLLDALTPKQWDLLKDFKKNVATLQKPFNDDDYHVRWLIAREWDLGKAEKMLRDSMEWRKRYHLDKLLEWEPTEVIEKYVPGGYFGHTKEGYPVYYELPGKADFHGLLHSVSKLDAGRSRFRNIEYLFRVIFPQQSKKHGRYIRESAIVFDLEDIGMKHFYKPAIDMATEWLSMVEANYPEALNVSFIINGNRLLPLGWSIAKPFLAPNTRKKIKILGKNWKEELLQYIDADQVPKHWGGTATDPDGNPRCITKICPGGEIPEKYHSGSQALENFDTSKFSTVTVNKGSTLDLEYRIEQPGSVLRWNFSTDGKDIKFAVYLKEAGTSPKSVSEMKEVLPGLRVNSHMVPEAGTLECEKPGIYVVHFDNSYSWINSKKVSYLIEVGVPSNDDQLKSAQITSL